MARIFDITDKLTFEENPIIRVKDVEIELNANALDTFKVIRLMQSDMNASAIEELTQTIFASPEDVEKVRSLKFNPKGYMKFLTECTKVIMATDSEIEGEDQTPATT